MNIVGPILVFSFVIFTLGVVAYALVRPLTHLHYRHRSGSGLWVHLP